MTVLDSLKVKVIRGMVRKGRIKAMWDPGTQENSDDNTSEIRTKSLSSVSFLVLTTVLQSGRTVTHRGGGDGEEKLVRNTHTHILNYIRNLSVSLKLTQK